MRLLHTADWHLGRSFHGASLHEAHEAVVDRLIAVARDERPDAILIAGDVFDRALPPVAAVELWDEALARLRALAIPVVVTSGNHDSAPRLGMGARAAEAAGIHVRTRLDRIAEPIELPGDPGLLVYAIPYLDPPTCAPALGAGEARHAAVLGAALEAIAADRARRGGRPAVVVAHGVVAGGISAEPERSGQGAERSIDVGGVSAVPAGLFDDFAYVALGHLHRPQTIGEHLRYCGSPVALSFGEAGHAKSFTLAELGGGAPRIEAVEVPAPRPLARLRGTLDELLAEPAHEHAEAAWVEAVLTDPLRPKQAMDRLRRRFPHVLKLEHEPQLTGDEVPAAHQTYAARVRGQQPLEIAERFLADVRRGVPASDTERELLRQALGAGAREEALR